MEIKLVEPLDGKDAYRSFRQYQDAFDKAAIPWNKKGSPHHLRIAALWYLRRTPMGVIVSETIRKYTPQLVANITANNALISRLLKKGKVKKKRGKIEYMVMKYGD